MSALRSPLRDWRVARLRIRSQRVLGIDPVDGADGRWIGERRLGLRPRRGAGEIMSGPEKLRAGTGGAGTSNFFLYVEGPRDEDILKIWARQISRPLARHLESRIVILGGRRPARAQEHFRIELGGRGDSRGLVVLDRDHHSGPGDEIVVTEPGLEVFIWKRRHIESYLLAPSAIRRTLRDSLDARLVDRLIEDHVPSPEDEGACRAANAKKILGSKGELGRNLGERISPAAIARAMRIEEFHPDILALYEKILEASGLREWVSTTATRRRIHEPDHR